ncbi:methyltransferase domain-containing protein [Candidatus Dependentiae bacterium]|nr:methyltransferase domain-containing protein [Candidatus Dependentiae bacterium]
MKKTQGVIVDIGTGDGKFVYELAKRYPQRLFIGIDPDHKSLEKNSAKIYKKPAKGGLTNVFYILANVENLPQELNNLANQIFIILPWSSLLHAIIKVEPKIFQSIKRIAKKGAFVDLIIGYDKKIDTKKIDLAGLDENYIQDFIKPKLKKLGFKIQKFQNINKNQLFQIPSSWAKKLTFGKTETFYYIRLSVQ